MSFKEALLVSLLIDVPDQIAKKRSLFSSLFRSTDQGLQGDRKAVSGIIYF